MERTNPSHLAPTVSNEPGCLEMTSASQTVGCPSSWSLEKVHGKIKLNSWMNLWKITSCIIWWHHFAPQVACFHANQSVSVIRKLLPITTTSKTHEIMEESRPRSTGCHVLKGTPSHWHGGSRNISCERCEVKSQYRVLYNHNSEKTLCSHKKSNLQNKKNEKKKTKHTSTHPFFTQWNSPKRLGFPNPMKRLPLTHAPISGHTFFSQLEKVQKLHHVLSSTKVQTIDLTARVDAILWHHQAPGDKAERNSSESKVLPFDSWMWLSIKAIENAQNPKKNRLLSFNHPQTASA